MLKLQGAVAKKSNSTCQWKTGNRRTCRIILPYTLSGKKCFMCLSCNAKKHGGLTKSASLVSHNH